MNAINKNTKRNGFITLSLLALPFASMAQEAEAATSSYFSNALFNTLVVTILLLAVLISALSGVMKNITNSEMFMQKLRRKIENSKGIKNTHTLVVLFSLLSLSSFAGEATSVVAADSRIGGIDQFTFYVLISVIIMELIFIAVMLFTMSSFLKADEVPLPEGVKKVKEKTIIDKFISDAVEDEESILLDHDYDGIKELDNNLPPWWKYGFYLTILVAVVYLTNFHILGTSPLQGEEYKLSIKKAEADIAAYMKNSADNVDETTVKMLDNPADLAAGKDIFLSTCSACHGKFGEGTVGPNLTDDYWLHSGSIKDIFKTIKYGYPDKGMKSWKEDYSAVQIAQVASYIRTLKGTNPPKPKDKQGELYIEQAAAPADSTATPGDSTKVKTIIDTLATKIK